MGVEVSELELYAFVCWQHVHFVTVAASREASTRLSSGAEQTERRLDGIYASMQLKQVSFSILRIKYGFSSLDRAGVLQLSRRI